MSAMFDLSEVIYKYWLFQNVPFRTLIKNHYIHSLIWLKAVKSRYKKVNLQSYLAQTATLAVTLLSIRSSVRHS